MLQALHHSSIIVRRACVAVPMLDPNDHGRWHLTVCNKQALDHPGKCELLGNEAMVASLSRSKCPRIIVHEDSGPCSSNATDDVTASRSQTDSRRRKKPQLKVV